MIQLNEYLVNKSNVKKTLKNYDLEKYDIVIEDIKELDKYKVDIVRWVFLGRHFEQFPKNYSYLLILSRDKEIEVDRFFSGKQGDLHFYVSEPGHDVMDTSIEEGSIIFRLSGDKEKFWKRFKDMIEKFI